MIVANGRGFPVERSHVMVVFEVGMGWSWSSNGEAEGSLR